MYLKALYHTLWQASVLGTEGISVAQGEGGGLLWGFVLAATSPVCAHVVVYRPATPLNLDPECICHDLVLFS